MSDIPRYSVGRGYVIDANDNGPLVKYADHIAAVAAARTEEVLNRDSVWGDGYSQAMHDAFGDMSMEEFVAAAEQRVRDELPPNGADALWYLLGQRKGVQAARDAVERKTWVSVYELSDESKAYNKGIRTALDAIDALEKP